MVAGGAVTIPSLHGWIVPGLAPWALVGLVPLIGGVAAWRCLRRGDRQAFVSCHVAAALLLFAPLMAGAVMALNAVKPVRPLIELTDAADRRRELRIVSHNLGHLPSLHFYCRRDVFYAPGELDAVDMLNYPVPVCLFTSVASWEKMAPRVSGPHRVLGRGRDLYRGSEVVVVTNQ